MTDTGAKNNHKTHTNKHFLVGLARAFAGAILFSFPLIMTMEMWSLGFTVERPRLALFMFLAIPLLAGLSYFIGFEDTSDFIDDIIDAFVAYAVGFITSAVMLFLFNLVDFTMSADEIIGKISIQAVIAAIGAMLAQSELGASKKDKKNEERKKRNASYWGELFLMAVGALFLAMNPAPTEEIVLLGYKMSDTQIIILAIFTIIMTHAFVYNVEFRGQEKRRPENSSFWSVFLRYTVVGYAIVLLISLYLLWTFGKTDGLNLEDTLKISVVMGFPGALGAAASRLIL
ncbi:MAG: TIGR02587 family membrane protein [Pyrinomonadaceae bacterium]